MKDEKTWENGRVGSYQLRGRYKDKGVEGELGRLYEAYNVHTGASALVLIPDQALAWEPEETWEVRASSRLGPPHVVLEVERASASGQLWQLTKLFDVLATALDRVQENAQARAHLRDGTWGLLMHRARRARWLLYSWGGLAVASLAVMTLGVGLWLRLSGGVLAPGTGNQASQGAAWEALPYADAPTLIDKPSPDMEVIAYPLPAKPFRNQAKAPCKPKEGEVEINSGCWVEIAKRPPCFENQAEYQGKCYLPVSARSREPQAARP